MRNELKRQELYDLVWSMPRSRLAKQFGFSDVALAKTCRCHGIPMPPRGHWAKIRAGKKTVRQDLPPRGLGMPETVVVRRRISRLYRVDRKNLLQEEIPPPPEFPESLDELTERVRKLVGKVGIPRNFTKAHRLIADLLQADDARREKQQASRYPSVWDAPFFDSPFERRRLRLLNAIFVALQKAGMKPWLRGSNPNEFGVSVGEQGVTFTLDHPKQRRDAYRPAGDSTRPASEKLGLEIRSWRKLTEIPLSWEDKGEKRIESEVGAIVIGLVVAGEMQYRQGRLAHHEWLVKRKAELEEEERQRREEKARREREARIKAEKARIDRLLGEAAAFRQAAEIRAYVEDVRRANSASSEPVAEEELEAWCAWALAEANRIDPVLSRQFLVGCPGGTERAEASEQ